MNAEIVTARVAMRKNTSAKAYSYLLVFARVFTKGTLRGIECVDDIPFVSASDAEEWIRSINTSCAKGNLDYSIADYVLVQLR